MAKRSFEVIEFRGHTRRMYPIDVHSLLRRSTLGMNGDDPTLPYNPSRLRRIRHAAGELRGRRDGRLGDVVGLTPRVAGEAQAAADRRCA